MMNPTTTDRPHRSQDATHSSRRWVIGGLVLAFFLIVAVSTSVQAQQRVEGNLLANDSSPIGFPTAEDTATEETDERPASARTSAQGVALRGPNTFSTSQEGQRDYLLGLSPTGGPGIEDAVVQRYENGEITSAHLRLAYANGCSSPNGQLTIRAIEDAAWIPAEIGWADTTRSQNGSVDVTGPRLATVPLSTSAVQEQPNVGCAEASIELPVETVHEILTGELGGIGLFWQGEQPLNVSTLESSTPPQLVVAFTTNAPSIEQVSAEGDFPIFADTGKRISVFVNASDDEPLPSDAVRVTVTRRADGVQVAEIEAQPEAELFLATYTIPTDGEGAYDIQVHLADADGWQATSAPEQAGPDLIADASDPQIGEATLKATPPSENVMGDQHQSVPLAVNVSDLSCQAEVSSCGTWELNWRGLRLANGTLTPSQRIETNITLPRPGNTSAQLIVRDAVGNENQTTRWGLLVQDTHPPAAVPTEGTLLAPNQSATIENGTPLAVNLQIEDDLPVNASLLFEGTRGLERNLPAPDEQGRIRAELDLPEGGYAARLVLDDGTHTRQQRFGQITIAPPGAPSVSIDVPAERIRPDAEITATIEDRNLDAKRTNVQAEVNGLTVQPELEEHTHPEGQRLTIALGDLVHDDEVEITVRAHDAQGLSSNASAQVRVDALAPRLLHPANQTWYPPATRALFEAEDPGGGTTEIDIDVGGLHATGTTPLRVDVHQLTRRTGSLEPLTLTLSDDLGNTRTQRLLIGIDEQKPEVTTTFDADGLIVLAEDNASGVEHVSAWVGLNGAALNQTQVFQDSPTRFFVATPSLTRGDELTLAITVDDIVGNRARLGTLADPVNRTVPDRPPSLSLERVSAAVGATGHVNWSAQDPDEDPLDVELTIASPSGDTEQRSVDALGSEEIEPSQPGRYTVSLRASSAGQHAEESTVFYLARDGRVTTVTHVSEDLDPDEAFTFELSFPHEPQRVLATATDEQGAAQSGEVDLQGTRATATFEELAEGEHEITATVVHETGAVEEVHVATVQSSEPIGERLGDFILPLLVVLALLMVVAIAALWYRRRQEQEDHDKAQGEATTR